jgi:hypothetical protein
VPGVVELSGARAVSRSGVAGRATREGLGTVTIGRLALGGGVVVLEGLRWEVHQRTGKLDDAGGSFSVKGITIGGTNLAPPTVGQLAAALQQVNDALKPIGLRLDAPTAHVDGGVASVGPLGIHVQASEPGRAVGAPLVGAIQPVRDPITSGIIKASPEAGGLVTIGDITIGALTGKGGLDLQLGGGSAYTEGERFASPFGSFDLAVSAVALGADTSPGVTPAVGTEPAPVAGSGGARAKAGKVELAGARHEPGTTGGAAAMVGLVGLLAVLSMAGADWWRLRHEPRRISL